MWVRLHSLLRLRYVELPVVVEEPIERLEHLGGREVQLVEYDPVAVPERRHQYPLLEHELRKGGDDEREGVALAVEFVSPLLCFPTLPIILTFPSELAMYDPVYSCTSVCSWLLILTHLCPVRAAR